MPILTGCCCFTSLKDGSRASAIFTIVIAVTNIIIDIAGIVRMTHLFKILVPQEQWVYFPPGILPLIYIELFLSVGLIILAIVLLIGINYAYDGKKMLYAWIYGMILDRIYDFFLGVYILVWIGGHRFADVVYVLPESIVVAVYWILNSFILIAAILCVISYWQELQDDIYGKERRMKYYKKLANIRVAALSGRETPGTSRSYYSSGSRLGLSQSQLSLYR